MKGVSALIGLLVSFGFHIFYVLPVPDDWQKGSNDWVPVQKECVSCKQSRSTKDQITQESQDSISRVLVPPPAKSFASPQLSNNNNKQVRYLQQNSPPAQQFPYQFVENKPAFSSFPQSPKATFSGFPTYDPLKNVYPLDNGQLFQTNHFIKFPGNNAPSQGKYIQMFAFPQPYQFQPSTNQLIPSTINQFTSNKNQFPLPSNQFQNQFQPANNQFLTPTNRFQNSNNQFPFANPFVSPTNPFPFGKPFQFDQPNFQQPSQQPNLFQQQLIPNTIQTIPKKSPVSTSTQKIKLQETSTPKSSIYSPVKNIQQSYPNEEIQLLYVPVETINQKNRNNKNIKNTNSVTQPTTPSLIITEPHRFQSQSPGNFPISSTAFNSNFGFGPTFNSFTDVPVHNSNFKFPGESSSGLSQPKFQEPAEIHKIPDVSKQHKFFDQNMHHQTQDFQQQKFTEPHSNQQHKFTEPQVPDFLNQQNFKEAKEYVRKPDFHLQQTNVNEQIDHSVNTQHQDTQPGFHQSNFPSKPSKLHDVKDSEQNLHLLKNSPQLNSQFYPDPTLNTLPNPTFANFISSTNFQPFPRNQSHSVILGDPTTFDFSTERNVHNSQNAIKPSIQTFHLESVKIPQETSSMDEQSNIKPHTDNEPLVPSFKGTILQPQVNSQQDIAWYDIPAMEKAEEEFSKQKTNKPFKISTTETTSIITTESSTLPPPYQPPLSIYMDKNSESQSGDILELLKVAKTIPVIDTVEGKPPIIFIGPSELSTPSGYRKYELPYLSSLDSNRLERMVDPFFVAPLNFKPPTGYIKIIFPPPHIGSVVVSNGINPFKELHEKLEPSTKISTHPTTIKVRSTTPAPSNYEAQKSTTQLYRTRPTTKTQNLPSTSATTSKSNRRRKPIHRGFTSTTSSPQTIESVEEYVKKTSPLTTTKTYLKFDDYIIKQTTIPQEEIPEQKTELYYTNSPKHFTDNLIEPRFPLHSIQNTSDHVFTAPPSSDISLSPTYDNFIDAVPSTYSIPVTSTNKSNSVPGNFNQVKSISQFINSYGGDVTAPSSDENVPQWPTVSQFNLSTNANFDKDSQSANDFQSQLTTQPSYQPEDNTEPKNDAANAKVEKQYNSNTITNTNTPDYGLDSKVQSFNEFQSQYNPQNSGQNNYQDKFSSNESYLKDAQKGSIQDYHDTYSSINHEQTPISSNDNHNKYSTDYSYTKEYDNEYIKNSPSEENFTNEPKTQKDSPNSSSNDQANVRDPSTWFDSEYSNAHLPTDESYVKDIKPQINKFNSHNENSQYDSHYPNEKEKINYNYKPTEFLLSTSTPQVIQENYHLNNIETTSTFDSLLYSKKPEPTPYSPSSDKEIESSQNGQNDTTSAQENYQNSYSTYSHTDSPSAQDNIKQSEMPSHKYEEPSYGFTSEEVTNPVPDVRSSESSSSQESSTASSPPSSQEPFTNYSREPFVNSQESTPTTQEISSTTRDYTRRHQNRQRYRHRYSTSSTEHYENVEPSTRRSYHRKPTEDDISSTTRGHRRRRPLKLSTTTEAEKSYEAEISSTTTEYVSSSTPESSSRPTETTVEVTTHRLFKPRTRPTPEHATSEADIVPSSTEFIRSTTAEAPSTTEQTFESTSHRSFKPRIRTTSENSRYKFNRRTTTTTTESPTDSIPPSAPASNEVITQEEKRTTEYSEISSQSDVIAPIETSQRQDISSEKPQPQEVTNETSQRHDSSSETSVRHDVSTYSNDPLEENVILNMLPRSYNYSGKQSRNMQIVYPMNVDATQRDHFATNDDPKEINVIGKENDNGKKEFDLNGHQKKVSHHRRKGTWVRKIRVKKPHDVLETAESQNLGHSKNAIRTLVRKTKTKTTTTETPSTASAEPEVIEQPNTGFSDMFAEMFGEYVTEQPVEVHKYDGRVTSENSDFYTNENNKESFINSNTPDELILAKENENLNSSEKDKNEKISEDVSYNSKNKEGENEGENNGQYPEGDKEQSYENRKPTVRKIEGAYRSHGKNHEKELEIKENSEKTTEKNEFKLENPFYELSSPKSVDINDHSLKKNESNDHSIDQQVENSNEGQLEANSNDQDSNIQETPETQTQRESNEQDFDQRRDAQPNGHAVGDYNENDSNKRENSNESQSQMQSNERETNENGDSDEPERKSNEKDGDSSNEQNEEINEKNSNNSNEEGTTEQPNSESINNESTNEKILTSTTTEISLETEICYKGRCVKTKKTKATDLIPTE